MKVAVVALCHQVKWGENRITVSCRVGSLSNGASFTATLVVTVKAPGGSTITDSASVSASSSDPNAANNTATVSTGVYGGRHYSGLQ
jgi:hypothetical protein